ncbi:conjugal transfer protein [Mycobacterium haemophilum]
MPILTNTWKHRLTAGARAAGRIILAVLVVSAAINGIAVVWRAVFPPSPPPIAFIASQVGNQADLAKAFAIDCVTTYLTASTTQAADLGRCFPHADALSLPTTPALIVSAPTAYASRPHHPRDDVTTYAVMVGVTELSYPTARPTRAYYQIPVSIYRNAGPRALDNLARVDPPPPGTELKLGYPVAVTANTPLFTMLSGFLTCYLTKAPGLERFITTDSGLSPLAGYAHAAITAAAAATNPPDNPTDNTELPVHIDVSARRSDYTQITLSYPLTLRSVGGSWFVAQIDAIPILADTTPTPVPTTTAGGSP